MVKVFPGWWQVIVSMNVQAVSSAGVFMCYSIIAAQLQTAFQPSTMVLMLGVTVTVITGGIMGPFMGAAIDRFSIRRLMLAGSACLALGFFLLSVTTSMLQVLAVYMVMIAAGNLLLGQLPTTTLLVRWFVRRRGLAIGIATSGVALGGILVPPFLQYLMDSFDWRVALQIFSVGIFLVTAPFIALLVIDRPADRNLLPDGDSEVTEVHIQPPVIASNRLLRSTTFWLLIVAIGATFAGPFALISNMIPFVSSNGLDASMGAVLLSIYSAASFIGKLSCAAISDRVDNRLAFIVILLAIGLSMGLFAAAESYTLLLAATLITGLAAGAALPMRSIILADVYGPNQLGRVLGLVNFCTLPFTLLAPPLFGLCFDRTGSYDFILTANLLLVVSIALIMSRSNLSIAPREEAPARA